MASPIRGKFLFSKTSALWRILYCWMNFEFERLAGTWQATWRYLVWITEKKQPNSSPFYLLSFYFSHPLSSYACLLLSSSVYLFVEEEAIRVIRYCTVVSSPCGLVRGPGSSSCSIDPICARYAQSLAVTVARPRQNFFGRHLMYLLFVICFVMTLSLTVLNKIKKCKKLKLVSYEHVLVFL